MTGGSGTSDWAADGDAAAGLAAESHLGYEEDLKYAVGRRVKKMLDDQIIRAVLQI